MQDHGVKPKINYLILAENRRPVGKGRNIASDKSAYLDALENKSSSNKLPRKRHLDVTLTLYNLRPQMCKEFIMSWFLL